MGWFLGLSAVCLAQCPFFSTPAYPSLTYNIDATPWTFELQVFGDTTGAQISWYRYVRGVQTAADAVLYTGPGSNTVSECYPETSPAMRNTHYEYFCKIATPSCPEGVTSAVFDVQVGVGSDCMTMDGMSFFIESAPASYNEGSTITLTAFYAGFGGYHYFAWYLNGDTIREDENHEMFNDPDNFNYSVLTVRNCTVEDAGEYSVSIMDGPTCILYTTPKNIKVIPNEYLVFDDKNGTHVWSDPKNWWPNYNRIPVKSDSAVIRQCCNVDIANAQVGNLTIDMTADPALVINPQGALVITRHLYGCRAGDLMVQADATGNGALVLASGNNDIPATVQFYALSEQMNSATPVWQYMGYPLQDNPLLSAAYDGAALYGWTNTPNLQLGGNWQELESAATAQAFSGYCMTEPAKHTYAFFGKLNNPTAMTLPVSYNDQGAYPGFAFFANSWVAPIDISKMDVADFGAADATIYIMNTGTYTQAVNEQPDMSTGAGTEAGQYNAIPVHAAQYVAGGLSVIPPMQGFFVHTAQPTTLALDYNKTVYTPALTKVNTTATRAPKNDQSPISNHQSIESVLRLNVSGFGASDVLYLLEDSRFSENFDNGWDARKAYSRSALALSARTPYGPSSVVAVPELDGLQLSVEGGLDKYYTITITNDQSPITNDLYLYDKQTGIYTPLTDGAQYTYTFTGASDRLSIVRRNDPIANGQSPVTNAIKYIRDAHLYIEIDGVTYDACGRIIK